MSKKNNGVWKKAATIIAISVGILALISAISSSGAALFKNNITYEKVKELEPEVNEGKKERAVLLEKVSNIEKSMERIENKLDETLKPRRR